MKTLFINKPEVIHESKTYYANLLIDQGLETQRELELEIYQEIGINDINSTVKIIYSNQEMNKENQEKIDNEILKAFRNDEFEGEITFIKT